MAPAPWGQGSRGEDSRGRIDALRLMAAFIAHWDNRVGKSAVGVPAPGGLRVRTSPATRRLHSVQEYGRDIC